MATQSSNLYSTNIRHMLSDLTPDKNGKININMDDDVIRGSTVVLNGKITFPPPPPKVQAIAKHESKNTSKTQEEIEKEEILKQKKRVFNSCIVNSWFIINAINWFLCTPIFYATFHSFCFILLCWFSSNMECFSFSSYAINGGNKCNFRHYNCRCPFTNWFFQLYR